MCVRWREKPQSSDLNAADSAVSGPALSGPAVSEPALSGPAFALPAGSEQAKLEQCCWEPLDRWQPSASAAVLVAAWPGSVPHFLAVHTAGPCWRSRAPADTYSTGPAPPTGAKILSPRAAPCWHPLPSGTAARRRQHLSYSGQPCPACHRP